MDSLMDFNYTEKEINKKKKERKESAQLVLSRALVPCWLNISNRSNHLQTVTVDKHLSASLQCKFSSTLMLSVAWS